MYLLFVLEGKKGVEHASRVEKNVRKGEYLVRERKFTYGKHALMKIPTTTVRGFVPRGRTLQLADESLKHREK